MSKHETQMTRWYWKQVGGTLIEEFPALQRGSSWARRLLDGLVIKNGDYKIAKPTEVSIELLRDHKPKSIESIALCSKTDTVLEPLLLKYNDCKVVVCPQDICHLTRSST